MTASNFDRALSLVLVSEGGYVNNSADPGGATKYGITLKTLAAHRGKPVTPDDVRTMTVAEAGEIYDGDYWMPCKCDRLPSGVDYAVFDFAVNSGPRTAIKFLQRCLSVTDDGMIGQETLAAVGQVKPADLINSLCDKRLAYLRSLGTWVDFGAGWSARVARVRKDALAMADGTAPMPVPPRQPDDPGPLPRPPRPPVTSGLAGPVTVAAAGAAVSIWQGGLSMSIIIAFGLGGIVGFIMANWSKIKSAVTADPTAKSVAPPISTVQMQANLQQAMSKNMPPPQPAPPANQPPAQKG